MFLTIRKDLPLILAALVVIAMILWSILWLLGRSQVRETVVTMLDTLALPGYEIVELKGFPNRYDFEIANIGFSTEGITLQCAQAESNSLRWQPEILIIALGNPCTLTIMEQSHQLTIDSFRVSVQNDGNIIAQIANPKMNGLERKIDTLVFAYDPQAAAQYGARIIQIDQSQTVLTDTSLLRLLQMLTAEMRHEN